MHPRSLSRASVALCLATFVVACAANEPSRALETTEPTSGYGVVAAPPLPVAPPATPFDPSSDIASQDGSTVVTIGVDEVSFVSADPGRSAAVSVQAGSELRAVSADGSRSALFEHRNGLSRIVVVDNSGPSPSTETFMLSGLVEPEAFSTDGRLLYVIDHQAGTEGAYRVRPLNLQTGRLENILGPAKLPFPEDMNGVGRRQVWAPDGSRLYTLYIRQTHHHHADGSDHAHGEPGTDGFVHVLDLDEEWAFCLDLPEAFGAGDLDTTALAVSPDGETVAVADLNAAQVAFASTTELLVTHTLDLPTHDDVEGALQIGLTEGHLAMALSTGVHWFDSFALSPTGPIDSVPSPVMGFTSMGPGELLVWSRNSVVNGPISLRAPALG